MVNEDTDVTADKIREAVNKDAEEWRHVTGKIHIVSQLPHNPQVKSKTLIGSTNVR